MASRYNLSPERKEKLKKEVMEEIGKNNSSRMKPRKEELPLLRPNPQPKVFKIETKKPTVVKPIVKPEIKKDEIKKPIIIEKKLPTVKPVAVKTITKPEQPKIIKKKVNKPAKKHFKKQVKTVSLPKTVQLPKVKPQKKPIPAPSPIPKKLPEAIPSDSFFKPDSLVKTSFDYKKIFKPNIKIGHKKMFILGVVVCLILALILALAINIFGIYKLNWDGPVSQKVINVLPLPAGTVDGRMIKLSDYYNDLNILKTALANNSTSTNAIQLADSSKVKDQLFNRLVSVSIIEQELKKYGQSVSDDLINEEMKKVIDQIGSEQQAIEDIKNIYSMDIPTFKNNVLKPILAMDMLSKLITSDEKLDINKEAKRNAEEALRIAQEPGTDFATLVLQYVNDPSTINKNGDMGWFSKGELPQEIENGLFSLKDGEIYNQVVKDDYGYHVYKVEKKLTDKDSGKESINLKQIFIRVNAELYIKSLFDKAVIKRFI